MSEESNHLSYPFRVAGDGRTAQTQSLEEHVRDELIQLMLTNPGERAFLVEFGGGARSIVFQNVGEMEAGIIKARIAQAIAGWLGHRLTVEDLSVTAVNERVEVVIKYRISGDEDTRILRFKKKGE